MKMLSDNHKELVRRILKGRTVDSKISSEQRLAIREICAEVMPVPEPERFLLAFVDAVVRAADIERIPHGVERDAFLSQLVTIFVDELHTCADEGKPLELGLPPDTPATAPRLVLDADSPDASL